MGNMIISSGTYATTGPSGPEIASSKSAVHVPPDDPSLILRRKVAYISRCPENPVVSCHSEKYSLDTPEILTEKLISSEADTNTEPVLPGHGDSGPDCGSKRAMFCRSCGRSFFAESHCMLRTCPHCCGAWASKESKAAAWRFWAGSKRVAYARMIRREDLRRVHCVISIPESGTLDTQRKTAIAVAKRQGLLGGTLIWHPFRFNDEEGYARDGYVHFHVAGMAAGDIKPGDGKDGIVFKHIPHPDGHYRGFQSVDEVRAMLLYALKHCGILEGRHALTWWGELSYNKLPMDVLDADYPGRLEYTKPLGVVCPFCGSRDTEPCEIWEDFPRSECGFMWSPGRLVAVHPLPAEGSE